MSDTGGWSVDSDFAPEGMRCLQGDEGRYDVVYEGRPLNPDQMEALANLLLETSAAMRREVGT
jgi:hypothetical protein